MDIERFKVVSRVIALILCSKIDLVIHKLYILLYNLKRHWRRLLQPLLGTGLYRWTYLIHYRLQISSFHPYISFLSHISPLHYKLSHGTRPTVEYPFNLRGKYTLNVRVHLIGNESFLIFYLVLGTITKRSR